MTSDEQTYVEQLLAGLNAYPAELRCRIEAGEWVVDMRNRTAFATGHLSGTLGFELSTQFATYLGWLYAWGAPLTLIGDHSDQLLEARRELARIGIDIDNLTGAASSDIGTLADGTALQTYRIAEFADLTKIPDTEGLTVLDVRQTNEYRTYHIHEALNIPLYALLGRLGEVPDGEVWVHCGSGYRASIAASIIEKPVRTVVLVDDAFDNVNPDDLATDP